MTRTEYQERAIAALAQIEELTVKGKRVAVALALILLVWIWVFHLGAQSTGSAVVAYGMAVVAMFCGVFWRTFLWKPAARQYELICPNCGASLLKPRIAYVAVVAILHSGKCQQCGATVLEGDLPPPRPLSVVRRIRPVLSFLLGCIALVAFVASGRRVNHDYCASRYAAARSADDSADVSDLDIPLDFSRGTRYVTCGRLR